MRVLAYGFKYNRRPYVYSMHSRSLPTWQYWSIGELLVSSRCTRDLICGLSGCATLRCIALRYIALCYAVLRFASVHSREESNRRKEKFIFLSSPLPPSLSRSLSLFVAFVIFLFSIIIFEIYFCDKFIFCTNTFLYLSYSVANLFLDLIHCW